MAGQKRCPPLCRQLHLRLYSKRFVSKDELKAIIAPEAIPTARIDSVTLKCEGEAFPESHRAIWWWASSQSHRAIRVTVTDYRSIDQIVMPEPGTLSALDRTDVSMMESQLSARQTKRS